MNRLKLKFKAFTFREQVLMTLFFWAILIWWLSSAFDSVSANTGRLSSTSQEIGLQNGVLAEEESVRAGLADLMSRFNPERTFDSASLVGRVDEIARRSVGTRNYDLNSPRTQRGETFELHTMRVALRDVSWDELRRFEALIREEFPYITAEAITISADRRDPAELTANFEINSFELKQSGN